MIRDVRKNPKKELLGWHHLKMSNPDSVDVDNLEFNFIFNKHAFRFWIGQFCSKFKANRQIACHEKTKSSNEKIVKSYAFFINHPAE